MRSIGAAGFSGARLLCHAGPIAGVGPGGLSALRIGGHSSLAPDRFTITAQRSTSALM